MGRENINFVPFRCDSQHTTGGETETDHVPFILVPLSADWRVADLLMDGSVSLSLLLLLMFSAIPPSIISSPTRVSRLL